jgi:hypothetical protein
MKKIVDVRSQSDSADKEIGMSAGHLVKIERSDIKLRNDFERIIGETPIDQVVGIACLASQERIKGGQQQDGGKASSKQGITDESGCLGEEVLQLRFQIVRADNFLSGKCEKVIEDKENTDHESDVIIGNQHHSEK